MRRSAIWIVMGLAAGLMATAHPALAQQPAATIVLDGSGSMAGWLDGAKASKMDMVRAALGPALATAPPNSAVGLVAFGHRRKGNCGDVEAVVAPEPGALEKTIAALPGIATTGKGPLVQALRQAAQGLGTGPNRSIIVLHDDPDNCNQDTCAAAASIAKSNPGLPIHVVTLGAKPQTRTAMACVATATGGRQFEVIDEAGLTAALAEVVKLAGLDAAVPMPKPAVRPDAPPEAKLSESGLVLTASLTPGGDALADPIRWRVTKDGGGTEGAFDASAAELVQAMPAGRYSVEAQLGLATAKQTIEIAEGKPSVARFDLNAGRLVLAPGNAGLPSTLVTLVRVEAKREPVYVGRLAATPLVVPAGNYELQLDDGPAQESAKVSVAAGADVTAGRPAASGRLELEAVGAENGPAIEAVIFAVEKDDPDAPQGRREIARSAAPRPDFTLPAGTYYVTARSKQVEARQRLAISAGTTVKQTMVLALSRLTLAARSNAALSPQGPVLNFRVVRLDDGEREVARSVAASPVLTLPAGRYRVEAKLGSENARAVMDTELLAGKDGQVTLDIPAGQVRLDRAGGSDALIVEVEDEAGQVVWHAGAGETATALLAPGRYKYRTKDGIQKTFEVRNGERQTLRLSEN
jgi:Ca-activated chloride channel family protein